MSGELDSSGTRSAARVADVLMAVAEAPGAVGVSDLARRLDLSKAVVHRILRSLTSRQLLAVGAEDGTYMLGPAAAILGARALSTSDLRMAAMPVLRDLQVQTEETTTVSALAGTARVYLDQVVSLREVRMTVDLGTPFPLYAGSTGKAILAYAPADLLELVLSAPLRAVTPGTIVERDVLEAELERVRAQGFAVSRGERQRDAGSVASPVFGLLDGAVVGSISVCGPVDRFDEARIADFAPRVVAAAERVGEQLAEARRPLPRGRVD